ncbi:uncharacterized protein VTP21DRAFT_9813 [Calcarisporiella thermophila]|uniref:uncharacterized protein n=1 Tax=Calcarisporiella thermophila TaxID=911321 RepID=UPI0037447FC9
MEEEARKRKERLEGLRKRHQGEANGDNTAVLRFRNYNPVNSDLQPHVQPTNASIDIDTTVEKEVAHIPAETLQKEEENRAADVDIFNLAPRKPNWDLKRDVDKKLKRLEKKTQNSIAELIRRRLQQETGEQTNLADAVEAQQKAAKTSEGEEDDSE